MTNNEPYKSIITRTRDEMQELLKDIRKTNFLSLRVSKVREYEKRLQKIESRLESMEDQLSFQDQAFQSQIRDEHESDLQKINEFSVKILEELSSAKGLTLLLAGADEFRRFFLIPIGIAKIVTRILKFFKIPVAGLNRLIAWTERHLLPDAR